jgi:hypothetical protein
MSIQTPRETTLIPDETPLTDRQLILHTLGHVEQMTEQLAQLAGLLEPFRPLLEAAAPGGRADAISLAQAGRMLRPRGGRRGH